MTIENLTNEHADELKEAISSLIEPPSFTRDSSLEMLTEERMNELGVHMSRSMDYYLNW